RRLAREREEPQREREVPRRLPQLALRQLGRAQVAGDVVSMLDLERLAIGILGVGEPALFESLVPRAEQRRRLVVGGGRGRRRRVAGLRRGAAREREERGRHEEGGGESIVL